MRLCYIALDLPNPISDKVGGACEKLIYHIVKEVSKSHEVHIIVNSNTLNLQQDELKDSVRFHGFGGAKTFSSKLLEYPSFASYFNKLVAKYDFDLVHVFSYPFALPIILTAKIHAKPVFFSELTHLTWIHPIKGFSSNAIFWLNIVPATWFSTKVVVPSLFIKERIIQLTKCSPNKVVVIHYGVPRPPKILNKITFREKYGIAASKTVLTFIGRLVPYKGIHNIIESMNILKNSLPNIHLVAAGPASGDFVSFSNPNTPYYERLQALTKRLDLCDSVTFTGFLKINELYDLLAETTIFVFPSTEEAFGLVLIEALSMGLPIIANNMPPMTEIVDRISGRFVQPNSPSQIAEKIIELLSNPALLLRISDYSRRRFLAEYELSCMINNLLRLYENQKMVCDEKA
jgi:glycosyltransferase involved in cell wall biosynthesis